MLLFGSLGLGLVKRYKASGEPKGLGLNPLRHSGILEYLGMSHASGTEGFHFNVRGR